MFFFVVLYMALLEKDNKLVEVLSKINTIENKIDILNNKLELLQKFLDNKLTDIKDTVIDSITKDDSDILEGLENLQYKLKTVIEEVYDKHRNWKR